MHECEKMKTKYLTVLCTLLMSLAWPVSGYSQGTTEQVNVGSAQPVPTTFGEVKRLDLDGGKVTIKHGEIKNLEMPPMTMVFIAKDKAQLAGLKVGDKITFIVLNEAGKFIAAEIQVAQ